VKRSTVFTDVSLCVCVCDNTGTEEGTETDGVNKNTASFLLTFFLSFFRKLSFKLSDLNKTLFQLYITHFPFNLYLQRTKITWNVKTIYKY